MFWKYNNSSSSQIDALLGKEDVTLQEVMDAEDIINECRVQNKNLIDFLVKPEVMEELVTLTTKEPSIELEERTRFKYPNIACELLTCDVPALNERLASDEVLLDKLYTFLECEPPLNPLLASYFSKIMGALIAKKTEQNWLSYQFTCLQVLDFLKARDTFAPLMLKHLGTSAVMDLMLKVMTQVEGVEMRQNILNWLDSQRIMQSLVALLNPKIDKERHYNVAQLLCDFIRIARDTQRNSTERADPDPLLNTLESPETVSLLLEHILGEEKSETAIVGGIQVLLALLDVYQTSIPKFNSQNIYNSNINDEASDIEQKQKIIFNTTQAICARVRDIHDILLDPPNKTPIVTTAGTLSPPVGGARLQVARLVAAAVAARDRRLLGELRASGTFAALLDLFFRYPWNNFLHAQVSACLLAALRAGLDEDGGGGGEDDAICEHLLVNCKLIERLLDAWKENDEQQAQEKGIRQGYMGHLISLVNKIVELCSTTPLGQYLQTRLPEVAKSLDEFKETTLSETNKIQDSLLGGVHPNSSVEDNDEYCDIPFPQSSALQQQMFSQYQMQNLTAQYIDGYSGFNDDTFNDGDDTLQSIDHRTDMNFDVSEGDTAHQHEIFKQVCAQNINTLDDADDQIFEERDHTFRTVIEKQDGLEPGAYSSDSDDDAPPPDEQMDADPWTSPKAPNEDVFISDPWSEGRVAPDSTVGGWADFSSMSFEANFTAFNDDFANNEADSKGPNPLLKLQTVQPERPAVIENDLRVENIEGHPTEPAGTQTDDRSPQIVGGQGLGGGAPRKAGGEVCDKSAAGDQGERMVLGEWQATDAGAVEPSKSVEGESKVEAAQTEKEQLKEKV